MTMPGGSRNKNWFIYILLLDGKKLYTGITTDFERRYQEHLSKKVRSARAVRGSRDIRLVYHCQVGDRSMALRIEYRIKKLTPSQKNLIIKQNFDIDELCEFVGVLTEN